ncbi:hypothetical protein PILCRDRAFT_816437 [Piloderma croceum F 1598]|uniref:XPG N-terminal domain-containing protein n=1 Tax=Piloderma croceum (strain F 1598) TaxID=765440 RepID=A0A0C3FQS5_PILCF|nr:hypothetical protein PILCRDRAFT_816437 [Piloderma croceum F 1598]
MGINELWPLLEPAAVSISLRELVIQKGFVDNVRGDRTLWIGVDASHWLYAAQAHYRETADPELSSLLLRCEHLARLPIKPHFVFDGDRRPCVKRNKAVAETDMWAMEPFKHILDSYGFRHSVAVWEAEFELALMSKAGTIDLVLTEDLNSMLFGAWQVAKEHGKAHTQYSDLILYRRTDVENHPALGFTSGDLIFIAIMSSGDYLKGLDGSGIHIFSQLARAGFGRRLINGVQDGSDNSRNQFLHEWRKDVRSELRTNSKAYLTTCHPILADSIPDNIPDLAGLDLYLRPVNREHDFSPALTLPCGETQAASMTQFVTTHFSWGNDAKAVFNCYKNALFPSIAFRQLIQSTVDMDNGCAVAGLCCPMIGTILMERTCAETFLAEVRVLLVIPSNLIRQICIDLDSPAPGEHIIAEIKATCKTYSAWLPSVIVKAVRPDLFVEYERISAASLNGTIDITAVSSSGVAQRTHKRKRGRRNTTKLICGSDGEVRDLSSEEYSTSESNDDCPPAISTAPKAIRKRSRHDTSQPVYTSGGTEIVDISSEDYSSSDE